MTLAPATRVDWFRVFDDMRRAELTAYDISGYTGIPKSTLLGYKNLGYEPDHWRGDRLLRMWSEVTGRDVADAPRMPLALSAAAMRR